ncbi:F-box protein at3g07870 [Phtheirospermum japonicum]|uniref:F-box protein at3g07870 n=1 Tax=Phtheirospermum japonicum TaxID=374723 RepID=A0A830D0K9_9LAMI|nr:F-box protein at3g07870 [Phtheirospermum japonicum]
MDYINEGQMKKAKNQNEKDESINGFDRLPYEIATDTLSRFPITSLVQLSYSCRSLNSLSRDPDFVSLHMSKSSTNESECVILHSVYPLQDQLRFICLSDLKVRKINIPVAISMPKFEIIGSSNGLLCLGDSLFPGSFCLYNPFRRGHLEIPNNFVFRDKFVVYGFGFHPITNDYKAIMIANRDKTYYDETGHRSYSGWLVSDV